MGATGGPCSGACAVCSNCPFYSIPTWKNDICRVRTHSIVIDDPSVIRCGKYKSLVRQQAGPVAGEPDTARPRRRTAAAAPAANTATPTVLQAPSGASATLAHQALRLRPRFLAAFHQLPRVLRRLRPGQPTMAAPQPTESPSPGGTLVHQVLRPRSPQPRRAVAPAREHPGRLRHRKPQNHLPWGLSELWVLCEADNPRHSHGPLQLRQLGSWAISGLAGISEARAPARISVSTRDKSLWGEN